MDGDSGKPKIHPAEKKSREDATLAKAAAIKVRLSVLRSCVAP
jgi:hypothetical protein